MRFGDGAAPGPYAFLAVQDNGVGMNERTLERLFQPFFTMKASGHGLGLAAVHGIVRGHRGALQVDSRPGLGSRFCVWFPLADPAKAEPQRRTGEVERAKAETGRKNQARLCADSATSGEEPALPFAPVDAT
jgi:hypothetical protein